jgi:hypothetical protein
MGGWWLAIMRRELFPRFGGGWIEGKARASFLKKRSKKLLSIRGRRRHYFIVVSIV